MLVGVNLSGQWTVSEWGHPSIRRLQTVGLADTKTKTLERRRAFVKAQLFPVSQLPLSSENLEKVDELPTSFTVLGTLHLHHKS